MFTAITSMSKKETSIHNILKSCLTCICSSARIKVELKIAFKSTILKVTALVLHSDACRCHNCWYSLIFHFMVHLLHGHCRANRKCWTIVEDFKTKQRSLNSWFCLQHRSPSSLSDSLQVKHYCRLSIVYICPMMQMRQHFTFFTCDYMSWQRGHVKTCLLIQLFKCTFLEVTYVVQTNTKRWTFPNVNHIRVLDNS